MAKLSILIPSRSEKYLYPTIRDCFEKAAGEVEVVVCLEGYWPEDWKTMTDKYPHLHTVHHGEAQGMRPAINSCAGSAISRGAKYLMKLDAHCLLDEGYDEKLLAKIESNWIVVPRRKRLDPDAWTLTEAHKPDIDYHYLSFPDDPNDFGGPGLNGKVWNERAAERRDKPEYDLDDEMSSQGSAWLMAASYFQELELMDTVSYGPFWNEAQELFLKCWLSGGRGVINKKTFYAHLHKGKTHGRGYHLPESWLKTGATFTKLWMFNEAWPKQTLPFKWLIERFWPVPSWPENWEEVLYATRKPRGIVAPFRKLKDSDMARLTSDSRGMEVHIHPGTLKIHSAYYGVGDLSLLEDFVDVTNRLQSLASSGTLDAVVNNSTLTPGHNPFRGKKKRLRLTYSFDGGEPITVEREEKDWLIIGPVTPRPAMKLPARSLEAVEAPVIPSSTSPTSPAAALNDLLRRRFKIDDRRLRVPMPIELRDFHRDDLAKLFAELKFTKGAEIGVAEGHYSETVLKANPEAELWLVDPWTRYSGNPRAHSQEHQDYSLSETKRKTAGYNVHIVQDYSMNAVWDIPENSLDWVYIDGHHGFSYVMADLIEWSKRVKSGGIISGDDYYYFKWAGVVEAVQAYTAAYSIIPWYIFQGHKSIDFMWVKP